MANNTQSEQLDKIVSALLGPPGAPVSRADAGRPRDMSFAPTIEVIRDLKDLPRPDFKARLKSDLERRAKMASTAVNPVKPVPEGFRTVTPYLIAADGPGLIEFAKQVFGAEEKFRAEGSAGGVHGEVRVGDSMLMMGGGIPGREFRVTASPQALHVYVTDTDAVYQKALAAGATSIGAPQDHDYGERGASVKDAFGNHWYIATHKGESYVPKGLNNVNVYLHPVKAEPVIDFLKRAFGAEEIAKHASPDGVVHHAEVRVGDSVVEMGEAHGVYQPMPSTFYLYVNDVDALYDRALKAGAASLHAPADQPYGDRVAGTKDPFGNTWYIATHKEELSREEIERRTQELSLRQSSGAAEMKQAPSAVKFIREGFHTVTPYLIIPNAAQWIDFVKQAFGAEERFRARRPGAEDVIMHAEVKIDDSMIELADANPQFPATPCTLLLRVNDPDAVYARAIEAGATVFEPVSDHDYGSRGGTVVDASGNRLNISAPTPGNEIFEDFRSVTPHLNPVRSAEFIEFLQKAFGGEEIYRAQSPEGVVHHAQVRIGDSVISMGDAHGPYQPMPSTLHLYVPDTDALYERALGAGATSIQPPADQPYGDRSAGVTDPFGNRWFIATHIRDVAF
jgi:PhnB protein